jgi:hypothetical protein
MSTEPLTPTDASASSERGLLIALFLLVVLGVGAMLGMS